MAERGEPWPTGEEVVGPTRAGSQRAIVFGSLVVALAAGVGVAQALPVPDSDMQRVAWWLVAETAALAAVSAMQLIIRRARRIAVLAPAGTAIVIVLTAVAVILAAPAPEPPRSLVVTLGSDTERGISPEATVEAAAVFAPVPLTDPTTAPPTTVPPPTSPPTTVVGAGTPVHAVPTAPPTAPPTTTAPPVTEPPTTVPPTNVPATTPATDPPTTAAPTTVPASVSVLVSLTPDRSAPFAANGANVAAGSDIFLFVESPTPITGVRFWLGSKKSSPYRVETSAAWDLAGTASDGTARPFTVRDRLGPYTVNVETTFADGSVANTKVTLQVI